MGSIGTARASPGSARRDVVSALYVRRGGQWPCSWHLVWERACDFGVSPAHGGGSRDDHFDSSRSSINSVLRATVPAKGEDAQVLLWLMRVCASSCPDFFA